MKSDAEIAFAAVDLMILLDANMGEPPEWRINLSADDDIIDELVEKLNALREACGIKKKDHSQLYRTPPQ